MACCRRKETKRNFSFIALFTDEKRGKSHLRGLSSLLKNPPCRLAATGANTLPRPSRYSLTAATGSKRSSADSDLLLCHVRLRRTSRFRFGCASGCEHREIGFILIVPLSHSHYSRPPCTFSGRAGLRARICSAFSCDMFARVVWLRLWRVRNYRLSLCPLPHALATHGSCD